MQYHVFHYISCYIAEVLITFLNSVTIPFKSRTQVEFTEEFKKESRETVPFRLLIVFSLWCRLLPMLAMQMNMRGMPTRAYRIVTTLPSEVFGVRFPQPEQQCQKVPLSITDMFVIDHNEILGVRFPQPEQYCQKVPLSITDRIVTTSPSKVLFVRFQQLANNIGSLVQGYDSRFGCERSRVQIPDEPFVCSTHILPPLILRDVNIYM